MNRVIRLTVPIVFSILVSCDSPQITYKEISYEDTMIFKYRPRNILIDNSDSKELLYETKGSMLHTQVIVHDRQGAYFTSKAKVSHDTLYVSYTRLVKNGGAPPVPYLFDFWIPIARSKKYTVLFRYPD